MGVERHRGFTGGRLAAYTPVYEPRVWFCAYCGRGGPASEQPESLERVCSVCSFGLLLETLAEVAPSPADAFLVVDDSFEVEAISCRAEELLGVRERFVVRRPLTELLLPADSEPRGVSKLVEAVAEATSGAAGSRPVHMRLRPVNDRGLRLHARVGRCGPPVGALLVLEPTDAERIQLLTRG